MAVIPVPIVTVNQLEHGQWLLSRTDGSTYEGEKLATFLLRLLEQSSSGVIFIIGDQVFRSMRAVR